MYLYFQFRKTTCLILKWRLNSKTTLFETRKLLILWKIRHILKRKTVPEISRGLLYQTIAQQGVIHDSVNADELVRTGNRAECDCTLNHFPTPPLVSPPLPYCWFSSPHRYCITFYGLILKQTIYGVTQIQMRLHGTEQTVWSWVWIPLGHTAVSLSLLSCILLRRRSP
jgi:hypothetical protein